MGFISTKESILAILEQNRSVAISGEQLANSLGISRAAVSKAVSVLKNDGHKITAVTNKGYTLCAESDVISQEVLKTFLSPQLSTKPLTVLPQTESTNSLAKISAINGCESGSMFVASQQTAGRGRKGRTFVSPNGGIYLSMVLRPDLLIEDSVSLTTCAAVAVCRAIKTVCNIDAQIKWVNDIFLNGKKLCGILTEAATNLENSTLEYAIIGIGINFYINTSDFSKEIADIVTGLYDTPTDGILRTKLTAEVLNNLYELEKAPQRQDVLQEYKDKSMVLDKNITVLCNPPRKAIALDINEKCNLLVQYEDGEQQYISSGEISVLPS